MINKKHFHILSTLLLGAVILMAFTGNSFPIIHVNGSGGGYEGGNSAAGSSAGVNIIEAYVIEGAGYYLEAKSSIEAILNRVELQDGKGMDYPGLSLLVDNALVKIQSAARTYEQLIDMAEQTPYNQSVIAQLKAFAYDKFMAENHLIPVIFKEAEQYLSRGDITGVFKQVYRSLETLEALLLTVKNAVSLDTLPGITVFWQLNEQCCETSLFGSYIARVFRHILAVE